MEQKFVRRAHGSSTSSYSFSKKVIRLCKACSSVDFSIDAYNSSMKYVMKGARSGLTFKGSLYVSSVPRSCIGARKHFLSYRRHGKRPSWH